MSLLTHHLRIAVRSLRRNRLFAIFAILTLGLGIGANSAIFSVIDGVLFKPLPYAHPDRLVVLKQSVTPAARQNPGVAIPELYAYRARTSSFDALVEYHRMNFDLLRKGNPDRVNTGVVSHDFFNVLGIQPLLGRTFVASDDAMGADAVLVLSYSYWRTAFGGNSDVIGRVVQMNDRPHTIVGVLPNIPLYPQENDVYMPVSACPFRAAAEKRVTTIPRAFALLTVFGRLKVGATRARAALDVKRAAATLVADHPAAYQKLEGFTADTLDVSDQLTNEARPVLLILLGTTGVVLLIACSNIANLSLARLLHRQRELAIRSAVGAGRGQLVAQLLIESTVLSLVGGLVGLLFASYSISILTTFVARFTTRTQQIDIDPRVLFFTLTLSIFTGVLFGILPALHSTSDVLSSVKQGGTTAGHSPRRRLLQKTLVVGQIAAAVVLVVGAGLLLRTLLRLEDVDLGYRAERVVSADAFPNFTKYPTAASQVTFYETARRRLQQESGVVSAAVTNAVPLSAITPGANPLLFRGDPDAQDAQRTADLNIASPGYFSTLGIPVLEGRDFAASDRLDGVRVGIVNATLAKDWHGSPIGREVSVDSGKTWITIVGVAADTRQYGVDQAPIPELFVPLEQSGAGPARFIVRTAADPAGFADTLRSAIHAVDPDMPVKNIVTLPELREQALSKPRLTAYLLSIFAALALLVALAGVSGTIAIAVTQRFKEFALRIALGASRGQVLTLVIRDGLLMVGLGLVVGLAASLLATRALAAYLYETPSGDPITLTLVSAMLLTAGVLSCVVPAWRAASTDPITMLRQD